MIAAELSGVIPGIFVPPAKVYALRKSTILD
jgi:hypothetical protein